MTPSPRQVGRALDVLLALPPAVLQVLAERILDLLDALDGEPDLEADEDGELDQDGEAGAFNDGPWWMPANGPADCGWVRLVKVS